MNEATEHTGVPMSMVVLSARTGGGDTGIGGGGVNSGAVNSGGAGGDRVGCRGAMLTGLTGLLIDAEVGPYGQNVFVVDADVRHGALTGLLRDRISGTPVGGVVGGVGGEGLSGFAADQAVALEDRAVVKWLRDLRSDDGRVGDLTLLPVGDTGALLALPPGELLRTVRTAVERLTELAGFVLVDCPSGAEDGLSGEGPSGLALALCEVVQRVVLVTGAGPGDLEAAAALHAGLADAGLAGKVSICLCGKPGQEAALRGELSVALPGVPVLLALPDGSMAAATAGHGELPAPDDPLAVALRQGLGAAVPALFRSGFKD